MIFSSSTFLFLFLPLVTAGYYLIHNRGARNIFLTLVSLLFYAWGEPWYLLVMMGSIVANWFFGMRIEDGRARGRAKRWLTVSLIFNILLLGVFKYMPFVLKNLNLAFGLALPVPDAARLLPLGISFYTFHAISYVMDVYRQKDEAQRSLWNLCLYISFFPQLVMGPIIRYDTIAGQFQGRVETVDDFSQGARRFIVGLAKKVIIADNLALMVEHAYGLPNHDLSVGVAWLGAVFYHVQVFFDFSGYSDMALGLARMFGFHFPENFDYPMISKSITEFWRRWHISLSSWFRDYVFFPLGGSRVKSAWRLAFNMFVVWALTGLWHGADWKYLLWGISFFVLLFAEKKLGYGKWMEKHWLGYVYSNVAVVAVTVMLKADSLSGALVRLGAMIGIGASSPWDATASMYLREYGLFMALAVLCSIPTGKWLEAHLPLPKGVFEAARAVSLIAALVISLSYVIMGGFSPFVYVNF